MTEESFKNSLLGFMDRPNPKRSVLSELRFLSGIAFETEKKVLDLFLNNNTLTDLTADFFHDGNRDLWRKTRTVTMNFCGIKTIEEHTFEHLTRLSGTVTHYRTRSGPSKTLRIYRVQLSALDDIF